VESKQTSPDGDYFTLWALHNDGRMEPVDMEALYADVRIQQKREKIAEAFDVSKEKQTDDDDFPSWLLASFGVCSIIGAFTVVDWLSSLLDRIF
tara:strand:+ start:842 stop:1123 length:282 start_codon:yes stop_codon:yes gene_type:complete